MELCKANNTDVMGTQIRIDNDADGQLASEKVHCFLVGVLGESSRTSKIDPSRPEPSRIKDIGRNQLNLCGWDTAT